MKIKYKSISKKMWDDKKKQGYTHMISGRKYMLHKARGGGTALIPVKIRK